MAAELNEAFERGGGRGCARRLSSPPPRLPRLQAGLRARAARSRRRSRRSARVYGAEGVVFLPPRSRRSRRYTKVGFDKLPICRRDAPVALARPVAPERADRLHGHRAGHPPVHLRGAGSSRSSATCRRCQFTAARRPSTSISTRMAVPLDFSSQSVAEFCDTIAAETSVPGEARSLRSSAQWVPRSPR